MHVFTPCPALIRWSLFAFLLGILCFAPTATQARPPASHTVQRGETLSALSKKYKIRVDELRKWNRLSDHRIYPGQVLRLRKEKTVRSRGKSQTTRKGKKEKRQKKVPRNPGDCIHIVRKGDTLWKLARTYSTTIKELKRWNRTIGRLRPGIQLRVCKLVIGGGAVRQSGAVQLASEGPGFVAPRRTRVWGQPHAVEALERAFATLAKRFPGTAPVYVGDLSFQNGGYMPPHKSHRRGIDADLGYLDKENRTLTGFRNMAPEELDTAKTWCLLEALLRTGTVAQFYIETGLQSVLIEEARSQGFPETELEKMFEYPGPPGSGRNKFIRHIQGHDDHLHVRFLKTLPGENASPVSPDDSSTSP